MRNRVASALLVNLHFRRLVNIQTFDRHLAIAGGDELHRVRSVGQISNERFNQWPGLVGLETQLAERRCE